MDAIQMIKDRRSVRKFKEEKVSKEVIKSILTVATYAPTWSNTQTARYTVIEDRNLIETIANKGMLGFTFNTKTLLRAPGLIVVSAVKGLSGRIKGLPTCTQKEPEAWEMFDAGIACQTLCLAAHEKGVGTVILGVFDELYLHDLLNLPDNEVITALIPFGYIIEPSKMPPRLEVDAITRFL